MGGGGPAGKLLLIVLAEPEPEAALGADGLPPQAAKAALTAEIAAVAKARR